MLRKTTLPISPPTRQQSTSPGQIAPLVAPWKRSLAARRVSPATIATYSSATLLLADYLAAHGMPTEIEAGLFDAIGHPSRRKPKPRP